MKKIKLILKKRPLVCLTANNIYTAEILDNFCDIILVGDSLGMVVYGENSTNKVTIITENDEQEYDLKSKSEVASDIINHIEKSI